MSTTITDVRAKVHKTAPDVPVRVRCVIGDGQKGGWVMLLDGAQKAGGTADAWVELGKGGELVGRDLEVSAIIIDIRPQTDRLMLTVEVDGPEKTSIVISHTGDPGDSAAYSAIVFFQ